MVTTIIFDLAGVIVNTTKGVEKFIEPLLGLNGVDIYPKLKGKEFQDFIKGKISEEEYWNKIILKNDWKTTSNELKKSIREHFHEIEGIKGILEKLKKKGFKLGLLSGHTKEWTEFLEHKFNFEKYFDNILYSYQLGYTKPDIQFYKDIIEKMKVNPKDCIYLDDHKQYLEPAKELGMKIIHFTSAEQFKKELFKLGILI